MNRVGSGFLVAAALVCTGYAGGDDLKPVDVGEKKAFTFERADGVLTLGGKSTTEFRFAKNAVMLNDSIPDEVNHFRQTLDTKLNFAYGEKKYAHKAIELESTLRFKTIWGQIGYMSSTDKNKEFKVAGAAVGEHYHPSTRSLVWIKNAWLQASWNAIINSKSDNHHYFKMGMFPFDLGRGIALGEFYGVKSKDFLAIYSRDTDYSAPGFLLTGEFLKDRFAYDIYYAKLEEKSASFFDVFNSCKEKVVGRRTSPWAGPAKDSDLFAARLKVKPFKKDSSAGMLELEPYMFYNEASDQFVEAFADSKSTLGAIGFAAEYTNKNFEFGGEVALNYGHENIFGIDRNIVQLKSDTYGTEVNPSVREVYSHVKYADTTGYINKNVLVSSNSETALINNRRIAEGCAYNDIAWTPDPSDGHATQFKNADDRYRCKYTNKYCGWMGVVDTSYLFDKIDLKVAAAYGYASGDRYPHAEEVDKHYKGFVGLHELYAGKRVYSVFMLDARKTRRPLTVDAGETEAIDSDNSFSDIQYLGAGLTWTPKCVKSYNLSINPNVLAYWKAYDSFKFDIIEDEFSDHIKASNFMGTELNLIASADIIKDLSILGSCAFFFPGSYYHDIKGSKMSGIVFNKLEEADKADLPSSAYTLGDDTGFYSQIALEYKF